MMTPTLDSITTARRVQADEMDRIVRRVLRLLAVLPVLAILCAGLYWAIKMAVTSDIQPLLILAIIPVLIVAVGVVAGLLLQAWHGRRG
jgi:hypothetical protein